MTGSWGAGGVRARPLSGRRLGRAAARDLPRQGCLNDAVAVLVRGPYSHVERATALRDRTIREATERWEAVVARAVALGQTFDAVAAAAGVSLRQVRAIVGRQA